MRVGTFLSQPAAWVPCEIVTWLQWMILSSTPAKQCFVIRDIYTQVALVLRFIDNFLAKLLHVHVHIWLTYGWLIGRLAGWLAGLWLGIAGVAASRPSWLCWLVSWMSDCNVAGCQARREMMGSEELGAVRVSSQIHF